MELNSTKYTVAIIGGDERQSAVAKYFRDRGHKIYTSNSFCTSTDDEYTNEMNAVHQSDIIILPLPCTKDSVHLSGICGDCVALHDLLTESPDRQKYILGGKIPKTFYDSANKSGYKVFDYFEDEELQQKNALPSAEGALMVCMENTKKTIYGSSFGIIGYGRIGKILSNIIQQLGGKTTVFLRNQAVADEISALGYDTFILEDNQGTTYSEKFAKRLSGLDVVFNTVPAKIIKKETIKKITDKPIIIELASSPGGIDTEGARIYSLPVIYAPSLPGRYAPESAGQYIALTVCDILSKNGITV